MLPKPPASFETQGPAETGRYMSQLLKSLKPALPPECAVVLLVFDSSGAGNFASNFSPVAISELLRSFADQLDQALQLPQEHPRDPLAPSSN